MSTRLPAGDIVIPAAVPEDFALTVSKVRYGRFLEFRIVEKGRWVKASLQIPRQASAQLRDDLSDLIATMNPTD